MKRQEKTRKLMGGLVLIVLGVLIFLNEMEIYEFARSWPLLLIVMSVVILARRIKDFGGWFIGIVGVVFFISGNFDQQLKVILTYSVSLLFVGTGVYLVTDYLRSRAAATTGRQR